MRKKVEVTLSTDAEHELVSQIAATCPFCKSLVESIS
jgi:hypothetical protein